MIEFSVYLRPIDRAPSDFEMGHMRLTGPGFVVDSGEGGDGQLMMVFIAISDLLMGVTKFLCKKSERKFEFIGADSSFSFFLIKRGDDAVSVRHNGKELATVNREDLIMALWRGGKDFIDTYVSGLPDGSVKKDIEYSWKEYQKEFSRVLK